jgi:hypothetical protein
MDNNTNTILSVLALSLSIGGTIIGVINHKRIKSQCCGSKEIVLSSLDIENTTPTNSIIKDKSSTNGQSKV